MHVSNIREKPTGVQIALLLVTLSPLYFATYKYRITHAYGGGPATSNETTNDISRDFVAEWLETHLISPFNPASIASYCNRTQWRPNLVFRHKNANGGIGNVRGNFLDFFFFAIEAGASIVLPTMDTRNDQNLADVHASFAEFDRLFDEPIFMSSMAASCPQMKIYKSEADLLPVERLVQDHQPKSRRTDFDAANTREAWFGDFGEWLKAQADYKPDDPMTLVSIWNTLWEFDTRSLPQGLRRNFGRVLHTNPVMRHAAAVAVENLVSVFDLQLDPRDAIPKNAFYGAHLRTEADAAAVGWLDAASDFTAQTDAYIAHAVKNKLSVIYVASGDATEIENFKSKAAAHLPPLNVTSKYDLLPADEASIVRALTWDQQAAVDFEVLHRCSIFGGFVKSSFSYHIALARNQRLEDMGVAMDPWAVVNREAAVAFDDGISRILGRYEIHERRIPRGMWP